MDVFLRAADDAGQPFPHADLPFTLTLPDDTTVNLTLTPAASGDQIPLARAATPDGFTSDQHTGPWRISIPAIGPEPALPAGVAHDLMILLTYRIAS